MNEKSKKIWLAAEVVALVLAGGAGLMWRHQANHFNKNITINEVDVGGLTAKEAIKKLKKVTLDNTVYVGDKVIYQGQKTSAGFTNADLNKVQAALKKQRTFFPSSSKKNYQVTPNKLSNYRKETLRQAVESALNQENTKRKQAVDAYAVMKYGKVTTVAAKKGNQYDVAKIMKAYDKQVANPSIKLAAAIKQPLSASSKAVQNEVSQLKKLSDNEAQYKVQNTTYDLTVAEMADEVRYTNGKYVYNNVTTLSNKLNAINKTHATLDKTVSFKTTGGRTINVQAQSYGWGIDTDAAKTSVETAWEKGSKQINAKEDIYGRGYYTYGLGYDTLTNNGIGNTYAEVSISEQKAWFYRNGKLVYTANTLVTGKVSSNEDTPKGIWYIMYKQSPSTLKGTHDDGSSYSVQVKYWAQFTNSGCGFHDATWRTNWAKTAYLKDGSNGCVNLKLDEAKTVYSVLDVHEPVIVY